MASLSIKAIRLLVLDVDGVLTDGRITYDSEGRELKSFHIKDGLGLKLVRSAGLKTAIITGRTSPMVERRARELGIDWIVQGREDKAEALQALAEEQGFALAEIAYMGDDLPDLAAVQIAGLGLTVADGHERVRQAADFVTRLPGGRGAVREACEWLLQQQGKLNAVLASYDSAS